MFIRSTLCTLLLLSSAQTVLAANAEEAARIKASLEAYVGKEPGVVQVSVAGDSYAITLDAMPYLKKLEGPDFMAYAEPFSFTAKPQGDGQWALSGQGPWGFQIKVPSAAQDLALRAAQQNWTAVFDEALGSFRSSVSNHSGISFSQRHFDPSLNANLNISYAIQSISTQSTATPDGKGGADGTSRIELKDFSLTTTATGEPGADASALAALNYSANAGSLAYETTIKGMRSRAILDLISWFIAHPGKDGIIRDQVQLKEKLADVLPVFNSLESKAAYQNLNVGSAFGNFSVPSLITEVNMNGAVKQGQVQQRFSFSGLSIPAGLVPPWAQQLLPTDVSVDLALSGFDLEAPARHLLAQLDLSKEPPLPTGTEQLLLPALVPTSVLRLTFGQNKITAPLYSAVYDGALDISLSGMPTGKFSVKIKGLDAIIATVQAAATDPAAQQSLVVLVAAKGLGKAEADGSVSYAIDIQPLGQVFVNGVNVTAMAGQQPPAPAQ